MGISTGQLPASHSIQIHANAAAQPCRSLAVILESLFPIRFTQAAGGAAQILAGDLGETAQRGSASSLRLPQPNESVGNPADITVQFMDNPDVPFPFRGRTVRVKAASAPKIISLSNQQNALATTGQGPVWAVSNENGVKHFQSAFALPELPPGKVLKDVFNEEAFIEMLPALHFLRELCDGPAQKPSPLSACFIFDDPNLHWPRYGFVDYAEIAARAAKENYHVSFATIPLDGWFTHQATAAIFRNSASRLSLCIHGNDHTKKELARNYQQQERVFLLTQAIRRIERLERTSGLRVCRVMVPPHGACSDAMLRDLPARGFQAACISHGSLLAHNPAKPWTAQLGYSSSEQIGGCLVLPRWGLGGNPENTILLAAYLNQPLILRGHHQDLKEGIERLDHLARLINKLGPVSWLPMSEMARLEQKKRNQKNLSTEKPSLSLASKPSRWPSPPPMAAILRRVLTEGRDRLLS